MRRHARIIDTPHTIPMGNQTATANPERTIPTLQNRRIIVIAIQITNFESLPLLAIKPVDALAIIAIHDPNNAILCHTDPRIRTLIDPIFPTKTPIARCKIKPNQIAIVRPKPDRSVGPFTHIINHQPPIVQRNHNKSHGI